jgi:hypothetical protein
MMHELLGHSLRALPLPNLDMNPTRAMLHMYPTCAMLHMHPTSPTLRMHADIRHELVEVMLKVGRWDHRWHGWHRRRRRGLGKVGWVSPRGHSRGCVVWHWWWMHWMPVQSMPHEALHACQWMCKHLLELRCTAIVSLRLLWGLRLRCELLAGVDVPSDLIRHKTQLLTRQQSHTHVLIPPAQLSSRDTTPGHQHNPTAVRLCRHCGCDPYKELL